jgi:glycosyltransferase involved in cell wall biosynthesis
MAGTVDGSRMERLRRVLFLVALDPTKKFGSLEEQILAFARQFRNQESLFLPVFEGPLPERAAALYAAEDLPVEALDLWSFDLSKARALGELVRAHEIELVHWNFYDAFNPYVWWLRFTCPQVLHVMTSHTSRTARMLLRPSFAKRITKSALLRPYHAVLGVSDFVVGCLEAEGWWREIGRFWHFVNTERFRPDQETRGRIRSEYGAEASFLVVVVAHLIEEKGVQVALDALAIVDDAVVLWVVGEGAFRNDLERRVRDLGLQSRVRFLGNQWFVEPFFQAADVALCPSLWDEAAGLVVLEAQSCGVPVVASHMGGIPEFVEHESTGFLVPPGDARELARSLTRLRDDGALRQRMAQGARAHAESEFGMRSNLARNLTFYQVSNSSRSS